MNSRNYKFRVWDKELNRFLTSDEWIIDFEGNLLFLDNRDWDTNLIKAYKNLYTIQQFIGILDKNKQEIYEGDFVRFYLNNFQGKLSKELVGEIKYSEILAHYFIFVPNTDYHPEKYLISEVCEIEILGNCFANKGLLNDK